ncbi:MAG: amidohydrolase family protein, partial [Rubrobacteraceae bacterium]
MSRLLFTGGRVVTAAGSYEADVLVEDEKIVAVGTELEANGAEEVDVSGKLVMPGFIDAHTHMDMPFGGTMTADDWATGTEAAAAGGTTMIIDFALQEVGGTLAGAFDAWTEKARDKAVIDYSFHVAITDLRDDIKTELPSLAEKGVASVKIFMAYKGTPLYSEDEDLFETLQLSKEAGVLVMVHAENGDAIAKLQQQALARGDVEPRFHALTRPE